MPDSLKIDLNVEIPLRDGVKLRADIYRPDDTNKHPVLLARLPYSKDLSPISLSLLSPIRAAKNGLFGVINKLGKFIVPPHYVQIGAFHNGLAWVNLSDAYIIHGDTDRWGYINKKGEIVWKSF